MVISHKHKYLFVEIPLTGSWSIHNELYDYYDGSPILHKHATYLDFRRIATDLEKEYFCFATVRNPLDAVVSGFFKLKTDHKGVFSDAEASITANKIDYADAQAFKSIQQGEVNFESAFLRRRIWERPYSDMIDVSANYLNFVMRFERLGRDFSEVLERLGINQVRPLPISNKTQARKKDWRVYYSAEMIDKAKRDFGPFMKKWDYEFPAEWGECDVTMIRQAEYRVAIMMKRIYLSHFRYSNSAIAKLVRRTNALLKQRTY